MAVDESIMEEWQTLHHGVCPNCGSQNCGRIQEDDGWDAKDDVDVFHWLCWTFECESCHGVWSLEWELGEAEAYWHEGSAD